jgi:acylphosphatase
MVDDETSSVADGPGSIGPGSTSMPARLDALVSGRVQGVGFRWFVVDAAQGLGLAGWVANLADGRVRCVAEGPRAALEALVVVLERGPSGAQVAGVETSWLAPTGAFDGFAIRSGGHRGD